ncbi:hypothetical protein LZ554_004032 [Drepanopeziza brunnea f. sp. 'monogermtubi']|nr:hypothetical protein LZ554_004032 [Drepanopeziza brunnea f. sp. 'monogermtubi']
MKGFLFAASLSLGVQAVSIPMGNDSKRASYNIATASTNVSPNVGSESGVATLANGSPAPLSGVGGVNVTMSEIDSVAGKHKENGGMAALLEALEEMMRKGFGGYLELSMLRSP